MVVYDLKNMFVFNMSIINLAMNFQFIIFKFIFNFYNLKKCIPKVSYLNSFKLAPLDLSLTNIIYLAEI